MSQPLRPFWSYYGGKWRMARHYPAPVYDTIIEPFAGAAGYSLHYPERAVRLVDKDPTIVALWQWLIRVPADDIRRLPVGILHVDEANVCQEAKWLIGWWLNKGTASPGLQASSRFKSGARPKSHWGPEIREILASQVGAIRHWKVMEASYDDMSNPLATWFVDPPYQVAGRFYRHAAGAIDFSNLGAWCASRTGQVIVCENAGADWLPFQPLGSFHASYHPNHTQRTEEVVWLG